jgi:hypothetical protein
MLGNVIIFSLHFKGYFTFFQNYVMCKLERKSWWGYGVWKVTVEFWMYQYGENKK